MLKKKQRGASMNQTSTKRSESRTRASQKIKKRTRQKIEVLEGPLWTHRQRQMHPIHYTVSYRASFKPELPDFFIRRYAPLAGATVLDPFGGRGTTVLQANLLGQKAIHNDVNPVASFLCSARQVIPPLNELVTRAGALELGGIREPEESDRGRLHPFFHPETLSEILGLRDLVISHRDGGDPSIRYIGLTALSRLYGHSTGFFSVYTFPQISIMPGAQRRNNARRKQIPTYRDIRDRIIRKLRRDLAREIPTSYHQAAGQNEYHCSDARNMSGVASQSVDLIVTSPPFLNKVNYKDDNWMRAWFLGLEDEMAQADVMMTPDLGLWLHFMRDVAREMGRVLKKGGRAVIEVGEVAYGGANMNLEEEMLAFLPLEVDGGWMRPERIFVNSQKFTKLSNCWEVKNNDGGTNTNRCLVLRKD